MRGVKRSLRAVSPLLATIILIAIVISAGVVVYGMISGWIGTFGSTLSVQPVSADLLVAGDKAMLSVSVKNTGNKPLAGIIVAGYDDDGKCFKLALPPADPGKTSGNTLIIPLGVSNIVLDGSGNNNHGTIYGAAWVDGKYGKALSFDGTDDYVEVQNSSDMRYFSQTLSFWVKPNYQDYGDFDYHKDMIRKGDEWGVSTPMDFNSNPRLVILYRYFGGESWWVATSAQVSIGQWNHVAVVWQKEQGKITVYINGVKEEFNVPTGTLYTDNLPVKIAIGHAGPFKGEIDEVRVYNRAQAVGEAAFSNANPGLPPTGGLVLWLPFDEGSSAPFSFTAGNRYALTITAYSLDGSAATQTLTVAASA